ncbi:hypothetical protein [Humibacillus xanthopallidus]|uniref:hypothetical protein n=1 Tax=Humibacillus xanthopallidus TaxID=412689 RepID=UPI00114FC7F6|nr:hypothetical protein [Humibacillus xanthopallidus]
MTRNRQGRLTRDTALAIFWTAIAGVFLLGVLAAVDPNTPPSGDPAWLGWVLLILGMGFVARAWRVGIEITQDQVVRHGWLRALSGVDVDAAPLEGDDLTCAQATQAPMRTATR